MGEQLIAYPENDEILYQRAPRTELTYGAYILNRAWPSPILRDAKFIHACPLSELEETIEAELLPSQLPKKIRIIRPDLHSDIWGVFFQY